MILKNHPQEINPIVPFKGITRSSSYLFKLTRSRSYAPLLFTNRAYLEKQSVKEVKFVGAFCYWTSVLSSTSSLVESKWKGEQEDTIDIISWSGLLLLNWPVEIKSLSLGLVRVMKSKVKIHHRYVIAFADRFNTRSVSGAIPCLYPAHLL